MLCGHFPCNSAYLSDAMMASALELVLVLLVAGSVQPGAATSCSDLPRRLQGRVLETGDSTCPSEDDPRRQVPRKELIVDLENLVQEELECLQQLINSPPECPGAGWQKVVDFNLEEDSEAQCPGTVQRLHV